MLFFLFSIFNSLIINNEEFNKLSFFFKYLKASSKKKNFNGGENINICILMLFLVGTHIWIDAPFIFFFFFKQHFILSTVLNIILDLIIRSWSFYSFLLAHCEMQQKYLKKIPRLSFSVSDKHKPYRQSYKWKHELQRHAQN